MAPDPGSCHPLAPYVLVMLPGEPLGSAMNSLSYWSKATSDFGGNGGGEGRGGGGGGGRGGSGGAAGRGNKGGKGGAAGGHGGGGVKGGEHPSIRWPGSMLYPNGAQ